MIGYALHWHATDGYYVVIVSLATPSLQSCKVGFGPMGDLKLPAEHCLVALSGGFEVTATLLAPHGIRHLQSTRPSPERGCGLRD